LLCRGVRGNAFGITDARGVKGDADRPQDKIDNKNAMHPVLGNKQQITHYCDATGFRQVAKDDSRSLGRCIDTADGALARIGDENTSLACARRGGIDCVVMGGSGRGVFEFQWVSAVVESAAICAGAARQFASKIEIIRSKSKRTMAAGSRLTIAPFGAQIGKVVVRVICRAACVIPILQPL
jgi:hypothetical protein